jgi:hypothetical protein
MWMCENKHFFNDSLTCPVCGKPRIPPDLSFYVHNILLPKLSPVEREEWLKYFTTIFAHGFEGGDFGTDPNTGYAWTGTDGSPTVVTSPVHHGSYAAQFDASEEVCYKTLSQTLSTIYYRIYIRFSADVGDTADDRFPFLQIYNNTARDDENMIMELYRWNIWGTKSWRLWALESGTLGARAESDTPVFVANQWYCIEVKVVISGTVGEYHVYFDGTEETNLRRLNVDNDDRGNAGIVQTGIRFIVGPVPTVNVDCVVVADTYIGPEVPPKPKGSIVIHAKLAGVI